MKKVTMEIRANETRGLRKEDLLQGNQDQQGELPQHVKSNLELLRWRLMAKLRLERKKMSRLIYLLYTAEYLMTF